MLLDHALAPPRGDGRPEPARRPELIPARMLLRTRHANRLQWHHVYLVQVPGHSGVHDPSAVGHLRVLPHADRLPAAGAGELASGTRSRATRHNATKRNAMHFMPTTQDNSTQHSRRRPPLPIPLICCRCYISGLSSGSPVLLLIFILPRW
eukprot:1190062-Pyramimonas_sp.AAC.1